jgi:rSAM/selenodomain-associated transferase 1
MLPTIPPPPERLLVFARLPEAGRVKTRLARDIGEERALALYEAMLRDTLRSIGGASETLEIEVMWAPTPAANGDALRRAFGERPLAMQTGETLGDRLSMAFSERFFFHRTDKIIAIGVDDPALDRQLLDHAFALLDSCEWVLGPATDGGYYLIGCRAAAYNSEVFMDVEWGTSSVMSTTLAKIGAWQSTVAVLPERRDIDEGADLRGYDGAGEVGGLLREWGYRAGA